MEMEKKLNIKLGLVDSEMLKCNGCGAIIKDQSVHLIADEEWVTDVLCDICAEKAAERKINKWKMSHAPFQLEK